MQNKNNVHTTHTKLISQIVSIATLIMKDPEEEVIFHQYY